MSRAILVRNLADTVAFYWALTLSEQNQNQYQKIDILEKRARRVLGTNSWWNQRSSLEVFGVEGWPILALYDYKTAADREVVAWLRWGRERGDENNH